MSSTTRASATSTLFKQFYSFIGLAAVLLFTACQSDSCHVKGVISNMTESDTLLLTTDIATDFPSDTIIAHDGQFAWETKADTARLCRIWTASNPQHSATFFAERGSVSIFFDSTTTRIEGTHLNDEWQALNDSVINYSQRINRTIRCLIQAGTPPSIVTKRSKALYQQMEHCISEAAERNKDNELGRFIRSHHRPQDPIW